MNKQELRRHARGRIYHGCSRYLNHTSCVDMADGRLFLTDINEKWFNRLYCYNRKARNKLKMGLKRKPSTAQHDNDPF